MKRALQILGVSSNCQAGVCQCGGEERFNGGNYAQHADLIRSLTQLEVFFAGRFKM